jgi:hypothetical protein
VSVPVLECPGEWSNDCGCPDAHNYCWPRPDTGCCEDLQITDDTPPERVLLIERMLRMAVEVLHGFSGRQFGMCPRTVRPCRDRCQESGGTLLDPYILDGEWFNNACQRCVTDCSCTEVSEVTLPGPVQRIVEVRIDGVVVDPADYRVDNKRKLVAQNGLQWPTCQDMSAPAGGPGTWTVTYLRGKPVPEMGLFVAGMLACELVKACTPGAEGACRLPSNVTSVVREGVALELDAFTIGGPDGRSEFGRTGIPEVDMWLTLVNPRRTTTRSRVYNPDRRRPRRTTWADGACSE